MAAKANKNNKGKVSAARANADKARRSRAGSYTPAQIAALKKAILAELESGRAVTILEACLTLGIGRSTVNGWDKKDPNFAEGLEVGRLCLKEKLMALSIRMGLGEQDLTKTQSGHLMFNLKRLDPSYKERYEMEMGGKPLEFKVIYDHGGTERDTPLEQ